MTAAHRSYREESRKNYGQVLDPLVMMNDDQLKIGALLRIADATEKMAQRHTELIRERDNYKHDAEYWRSEYDRIERRRRAAQAQITKLKKKGGAQ